LVYERPTALGGEQSRAEQIGMMRVADGESRVLAAVREQLRQGASQIKLMGGGGVASPYDPLYTLQFTPQELRAAVTAAEDYGTYVATHVYSVAGIERAVDAGVKSIEHGHLADEPTIAMLAERVTFGCPPNRSPNTTTTSPTPRTPKRTRVRYSRGPKYRYTGVLWPVERAAYPGRTPDAHGN
jgi:imidazolonepropionase-like amidohydrolase